MATPNSIVDLQAAWTALNKRSGYDPYNTADIHRFPVPSPRPLNAETVFHVPKQTVHVVHAGAALCGIPGQPAEWPAGHLWVDATNADEATCDACVDALARAVTAKVNGSAP